jgi:hypothetical protein
MGFSTHSAVQNQWYSCTHSNLVPHRLLQLLDEKQTTDLPQCNPVRCVVLLSVDATFIGEINGIMTGALCVVQYVCANVAAYLTHPHRVLATFPDCHIGSMSGFELNC